MESTFTFLRVRGIPIGANWSWLLVFALISWSLGAGLFPRTYPGMDDTTYLVMGIVAAVLFFVSILLHELGHAFRALKEDMEIDGITLWLFGGVAKFKGMFPSAGAEFRIAIAGPVVSVLLVGVFQALTVAGHAIGVHDAAVGITDYLARINLIVVAFNMVPALPLDGGRVLRSWLWHRQGSFTAATLSAAKAGRAFGGLLIAIGVLGFITGAGTGGLWFAFLGWFLLQAVQSETAFALLRQSLEGLRVRDLMSRDPVVVPSSVTIRDFVDEVSRTRGHSTYPVVDGGRLAGLVSIRHAAQVPYEERDLKRVADVMLRDADVPVLRPDQQLFDAVQALQAGPGRAAVMDDGRLVGLLSMSDIARALEFEQLRGPQEARPVRGPGLAVWVVVIAIMALAGGFLYRPPVAVLAPGEALDVSGDITITGVEVDEIDGRYLLTSVRLSQPTGIGLALAVLRSQQVVPLQAIVPRGQDPDEFLEQQTELFRQSQLLAAAAAARTLGMDVDLTGTGARVVAVFKGAPAAEVLEEGDVIVAVDAQPVQVSPELSGFVRARPPGTTFAFTVERNGRRLDLSVRSAQLPEVSEGFVGIGVSIETRDFDVRLPFDIEFREREIGGPSAGLAYALAIADLLDPDDRARGRTIAATGEITVDGRVGPVGGVEAKTIAARNEGAELFLVPAGEVEQARGEGLPVRGVGTLAEALQALDAA
jgi:PDZ domain-containing secreted protein/Zn-dependent protease/CBS domain-containing protein